MGVPDEVKALWAARDAAVISSINLTEYEPDIPVLDELPEAAPIAFSDKIDYSSDTPKPAAKHAGFDPLRLHAVQTAAPKTISIANYVPEYQRTIRSAGEH